MNIMEQIDNYDRTSSNDSNFQKLCGFLLFLLKLWLISVLLTSVVSVFICFRIFGYVDDFVKFIRSEVMHNAQVEYVKSFK